MKLAEINTQNLTEIKHAIANNIGKSVIITEVNKQGKKLKVFKGEIISVYDNLFLVKVENNGYYLNKTFTYTDFVTNEFQIEFN